MRPNPKTKRADAERAAEWFAHEVMNCIVTRRAVRSQWQKVDFFGSDIVGKKSDGTYVYIQATAGQDSAVSIRKRKLEKIPWGSFDRVLLVQLRSTEDPANARRKLWFFRVHELRDGEWSTWKNAVEVPRGWFKKRPGGR